MYGWHGRLLFINLTNQSFHTEELSHSRLQACIGGRGLALDLFRDYAHLDPFAPDMPLIMTTGPLSGTATPATERLSLLTRSPLTGTVFDTTAGGSFPRTLKATGYDGLFITGCSDHPVLLRIHPFGVEFLPAGALWGKTTSATIAAFTAGGVAAIGPAGENRVRYANIVFSDGDNDGRGGLGAVMGGKKLKAIAVDGDCQTTIADPLRLQQAQQKIVRLFRASPAIMGPFGLHEYGTPTFIDLTNQRRMLPTHNFKSTCFNKADTLCGPAIRTTLAPTHDSCHDCMIACKKNGRDGLRLPEYSALSHFGPLLGIDSLESIVNANNACREFGLDPISTAATLATSGEISGDFPKGDALPKILNRLSQRQNGTKLLGLGSRRLAQECGQPEAAMTVKSLELPAFDPRGAAGMALSFCTSTLGGTHTHANLESTEILRKPVATDRFSFSGKGRLLKIAEDTHAASDSLIICPNALYAASLEEYAEAFSAITGLDFSPAALTCIGEQIVQTEHKINRSNGFTSDDDMLPARFFQEKGSSGDELIIPPLNKGALTEELHRYNRIRNVSG